MDESRDPTWGTVVLVGMMVNEAIIRTDFINQRRAGGISIHEAIATVRHDHVRPLLKVTVTTVLGPLLLAEGFS